MKKLLIAALIFMPLLAHAQVIYPLHVYASAKNAKTGEDIKFMKSPENITYVGTCKRNKVENLCDLAKDGTYETADGVKLRAKASQLYSPDSNKRCNYTTGAKPALSC